MWITLTERQSHKSRSPKAVFVFGSLSGLRRVRETMHAPY